MSGLAIEVALSDPRWCEGFGNIEALCRSAAVAAFAVDHRDEIVEVVDGGSKVMRTILSRQRDLAEILEVFPLALENLQLTVDGDRIPVRVPPTALLPLGDQIDQLCQSLPLGLCDLISGTDPTDRPSGGRR